MRIEFKKNVLLIGFGAVGRCFLPLLFKKLRVAPARVTVIDMADPGDALRPWLAKGVSFKKMRITPRNLKRTLAICLNPGDLVVDLSRDIDCFAMLDGARARGAFYINASIEGWPQEPAEAAGRRGTMPEYQKYARLLSMKAAWRKGQLTAVLDHGANPGLISHFARRGLLDLAERILRDGLAARRSRKHIEECLAGQAWGPLAMSLGIKAIHCSEIDTQTPEHPKSPREFVGTWSVEGMAEESTASAEIGWGTHEKTFPPGAIVPCYGPQNQIVLPHMGMNTLARSWVPNREFAGMIITHGESFTLSHYLTVCGPGGQACYRPTVCYVYLPPNETMTSLHELRCRGYRLHPERRILRGEIILGQDIMGALLMGHACGAWWTGSILDIGAARRILPGHNATALQVAAGVIAAAAWMVQNPAQGLCFPEDLPCDDILATALPYLGRFVSRPCPWSPLTGIRQFYAGSAENIPDMSDAWQFKNFLVPP